MIRQEFASGSPDSCQFYQLYQMRTWKKNKYNKWKGGHNTMWRVIIDNNKRKIKGKIFPMLN
jgi:hypothetical protein